MSETAPTTEQSVFAPTFSPVELKQLTLEHPRDGILARERLRLKFPYRDAAYMNALDAQITRLPNDLPLRRAKMLDATIGWLVLPVYQPDDQPKALGMPTQKEQKKAVLKWLNPTQRAVLLQQAREGGKQAPNDGFFPWMEAAVLWNRDDEPALQALERAGKTSDFESGAIANQLALMHWKQTQRELGWNEKLNFIYATLLPHFAKFNQLNREVIWSGIAHYRRGDKAGAYRRWRIALEAADAMHRAQLHNPHALVIGLNVAEALQNSVWSLVAREIGGLNDKTTQDQRFATFIALARRDGENALADESLRERASFQAKKIWPDNTDFPLAQAAYRRALGIDRTDTRLQLQLPWASRNVYWLSIAGVLALLVCLALSWGERRLHRDFIGRVSVGQIAFFGALWLGFLGLAVATRESEELWLLIGDGSSPPPLNFASGVFDSAPLFWLAVASTCALSVAFCYGQRALEARRLREQTLKRDRNRAHPFSASGWPTFFWCCVFVLTVLLAIMERANAEWPILFALWLVFVVWTLGITGFVNERRGVATQSPFFNRLALLSTFFALLGIGTAFVFEATGDLWPLIIIALSVVWSMGLLIYLAIKDDRWRLFALQSSSVALQTLGGVAVVCSVALLIASLAALPIRARQNRIVDDYIARGEIEWMRSQPKIGSASATANRK